MPISCLLEAQRVLTAAMPKDSEKDEKLEMLLDNRAASGSFGVLNLQDLDSQDDFHIYAFRSRLQVSFILFLHYPEA